MSPALDPADEIWHTATVALAPFDDQWASNQPRGGLDDLCVHQITVVSLRRISIDGSPASRCAKRVTQDH